LREAGRQIRSGTVVLGRLGGDRQLQRLEASAELFECVAERDNAFAADLAEAEQRGRS
jgi:hypothetical protein